MLELSPNAVASDPTGKFLYVTDGATNQMYGFLVQSNGSLVLMAKPFKTDNLPNAVAVDPRGIYVYVANYNANDISAYTIDQSTGNATPLGWLVYLRGWQRSALSPHRAVGGPVYLHR